MSDTDTELPTYAEGPEEDIEIELTDADLGDEVADVEPEPQVEEPPEEAGGEEEPSEEVAEETDGEVPDDEEGDRKPKKKRENRTIADLRRRAQEAEHRANEAAAQLQREAQLRQASDAAMMAHYEASLTAQAAEAKRKLLDAKSLGDNEAEIDAQSELYKIQSDISAVQAWKSQQKVDQPRQQETPDPQPDRQTPTLEPTTAEWIRKNEWFQPQSPNFDAEMHEEATIYARRIERRYRAEGRADEIGSDTYFREIDKHVRTEFPDAFVGKAAPKKGTPPMARDNTVAPVVRTGTPGQAVRPGKVVKLSADQRRFAHNMAASGAYKNSDGTRMNNEQAEKHYAIFMMKQDRK